MDQKVIDNAVKAQELVLELGQRHLIVRRIEIAKTALDDAEKRGYDRECYCYERESEDHPKDWRCDNCTWRNRNSKLKRDSK